MPLSLLLVYLLWALALFEPEWWLASFGAEPLKRLPSLLLPLAIGVVLAKADRRSLYAPMALFVISHMIALPFATNRGYAMSPFKSVLFFYVLLVASAATIDRIPKVLPIVSMYLIQFAWWGIHGLPYGRVNWHSTLANEDAFGPMMVVGLAFTTFFALGTRSKGTRIGAALIAALCGVGIVAAVARGATLAAALVLVVVWLRSPRKLAMFVGVVLVAVTMVVASYVFFPDGEFWAEMTSISEDIRAIGTSETDTSCVRAASKRACGSGTDRWDLWGAGWEVFLQSPLLGVGPGNFGAYAAENFRAGQASGFYADPAHLYGRSLHNVYVQVLAEQGLIGVVIFLWLLVDFVRRNRALRVHATLDAWDEATNKRSDLRFISFGLEAALIGYLASGLFYDQLYTSSLYLLLGLNFVLSSLIPPIARKNAPAARLAAGAAARRAGSYPTPPNGKPETPKCARKPS